MLPHYKVRIRKSLAEICTPCVLSSFILYHAAQDFIAPVPLCLVPKFIVGSNIMEGDVQFIFTWEGCEHSQDHYKCCKASLTSHRMCNYVLVTEKNRLICKGHLRYT